MSAHKGNSAPRRIRAERGIYYRNTPSGRVYEITFTDSTGRQRWKKVEGGVREARASRGDVLAKLSRGDRVAPARMTLAEYVAEWLETLEGRVRPKTHERYSSDLRLHVLPKLGRRRIASITPDDVAAVIADMQRRGFAGWTIRGVLTPLGRVLGNAARRGLIPTNPVSQLDRSERPKVERAVFPSLDSEAVGRLIANVPDRYRVLVAVSVLLGIRQGEALGLRWQDVDTREGIVRVRVQLDRRGQLVEPKTRAAKRDVPMPPSLSKMLAGHRLASPWSGESDHVFASQVGTPLGVRNIIRRGLLPALEAADLPQLRWHDLRHVAASLLIAEGASVGYVSRILGHATPAITLSIYAHEFARAEHDQQTRDRMEAAFGSLLGTWDRTASDGRPKGPSPSAS
jgi:integrase